MNEQEFLEKYNLKTSFEQLNLMLSKKNRMSNFTFADNAISYDKQNYVAGFNYMFSSYMANRVSPKNMELEHTLDVDVNAPQFIRDYESAMLDAFEKSGSKRERKAFEGVRTAVLDTAQKQMAYFNDSLISIWAKSIRNGSRLDAFREASIGALDSAEANKSNQKEIEQNADNTTFGNQSDNIKINTRSSVDPNFMAFAIYKTLEEAVNRRTWGWRLNPFNWRRLREENSLMKEIKEKMDPKIFHAYELNEVVALQDFKENLVLGNQKLIQFQTFVSEVKSGAREFDPEEKYANEFNDFVDELNNSTLSEAEDVNEQSNDIDFDLDEINEDFNKINSENLEEENIFNLQDPNVYKLSNQSANDIFLTEDDILEAKDIEPAKEEFINNIDNIIAEEDFQKQLEKDLELEKPEQPKKENKEDLEIKKEIDKKLSKVLSFKKPNTALDATLLIRDNQKTKALCEVFANILASYGPINKDYMSMARFIRDETIVLNVKPMWNTPDKMDKHSTNMFGTMYKKIHEKLPQINVADKLIVAQKLTDIVLNVYSPVASPKNREKYGKVYETYGNNYAMRMMDNEDIQKLTDYNGNINELMDNVKLELGLAKSEIKENVEFPADEFSDKISDKSAKVNEHKAPVHDKVKE